MNKSTGSGKHDRLAHDAGKLLFENYLREFEEMEKDETVPRFDSAGFAEKKAQALRELQEMHEGRGRKQRRYKWIASVAVICLVLTGSTFLISEPIVSYPSFIEHLFLKDNGDSITISANSVTIPKDWSGKYAPTEMPLDYKMVASEDGTNFYWIQYANDSNGYILFSVTWGEYATSLDTENSEVTEIMIGDIEGLCVTRKQGNSVEYYNIAWAIDNMLLTLMANNLDVDTLIDIAERVMITE